MSEPTKDRGDLEARVASLEKTVRDLERRLHARAASEAPPLASDTGARRAIGQEGGPPNPSTSSDPGAAFAAESATTAPLRSTPTLSLTKTPADPGQWVNRLGIALLILGAAFGFRYSIDRGWIGPTVRVLTGLSLGTAMVVGSGALRERRPGLSRVLAGGGIACGYLSVFAAFQLYGLISHAAALGAMTTVTLLAFLVAVRSADAMAAVVGTIGGLATPFLLHSGSGNVAGLVAYTCLVASGASAVFASRGWRVVLWTTVLGAWPVLLGATDHLTLGPGVDAVALQMGIVYLALATWWLGVIRETLSWENPERWKPATAGLGPDLAPPRLGRGSDWAAQAHQLTLATPIVVLFASSWTWNVPDAASGWIALALAFGWGLAAAHLRRLAPGSDNGDDDQSAPGRLSFTHAMAAAVMLAFAMSFLLGEDARRVGLAAEALAVLAVVRRSGGRQPATLAHLLLAVVSAWTFFGMMEAIDSGRAGPTSAAMADLGVVSALAVAARLRLRDHPGMGYAAAAQAGLLIWFLRVLDPLANGIVLVTAAWFANAVAVLVAGLRSDSTTLRSAGAALMALTMAKLFVFDLATVDALWRIATFLGFGAVLLGLGYAFPSLWKQSDTGPPSQP